jgi:creatinine amidohydrolase/Fe(II)-dependent formamide hydrolase-like protein
MLSNYLPDRVNHGPWVTAYTLYRLRELPSDTQFVLPICSIAEPFDTLIGQDGLLLPPLYHEALTEPLKRQVIDRILDCFPVYGDDRHNRRRVRVMEFSARELPLVKPPKVLAFSVDTAVEEHGPHLPLGTDTIQSYHVLQALSERVPELELFRPLDYGQLTWGLPFGFSVDLTTELLTEYVSGFAKAVIEWRQPASLYVVDVHGSIAHRQAIVDGLKQLDFARWTFRWLHEPLADVASERGDQHAGGVETALVELASPLLLDHAWWPDRRSELVAHQMSFEKAVELTGDLTAFRAYVDAQRFNGIIGDVSNYESLDAPSLRQRMVDRATVDLERLISGESAADQEAGQNLW